MIEHLDLSKIFKAALKNGGDFADIFGEDTAGTYVFCDNDRIEKIITGSDIGLGLRVVYEGNTAYGYTNDLSEGSVLELANGISSAVKGGSWNKDLNFTKKESSIIHKIVTRPDSVPIENKVKLVNEMNQLARGFDTRVQQVSITYRDTTRKIQVANSLGELVTDEKIDTIFLPIIIASSGKIIQTGYEPVGGFFGFDFFENDSHSTATIEACKRALLMLDARPAPAGTMAVVLSSEAGGTMVHEAVGHGLEADLATGGFSVYGGHIGEIVASPLITVTDNSTLPQKRGSFSFDDEGTSAQRTILIENGILRTYMHNRITAAKAGVRSTGNGRRESYKFRPIVRMTNTIIEPGTTDPDSIIRATDKGLFVRKMGGGQVNTITGDFVFEVQEGYLISDGKLSDPVRGATLMGNGPDVLKKIDMIGRDLGYALGTCGKDGQGVPVGDAQPTLRIPELVIGGTA